MSHLRTVDCLLVEEELLGGMAADAARLLANGEGASAAHLEGCTSCRELASDLASLGRLPPPAPIAPEVAAGAIAAATAELRSISQAARRARRRMILEIALISALCLPLSAAWALGIWEMGAAWLVPLLPAVLGSAIGAFFALLCLAAFSALAFTLTLLAGAAARLPRPMLLEV